MESITCCKKNCAMQVASFPGSTAQLFFTCSKISGYLLHAKKWAVEPGNEATMQAQSEYQLFHPIHDLQTEYSTKYNIPKMRLVLFPHPGPSFTHLVQAPLLPISSGPLFHPSHPGPLSPSRSPKVKAILRDMKQLQEALPIHPNSAILVRQVGGVDYCSFDMEFYM